MMVYSKANKKTQNEKGITLVALIITVIILVILAAVAIINLRDTKMIEQAIKGTEKYAKEQIKEENYMNNISGRLESAVRQAEVTEIVYEIRTKIKEEKAKSEGNISDEKLEEILNKYGKLEGEGTRIEDKILLTTKGGYKIKVENILNGKAVEEENQEKPGEDEGEKAPNILVSIIERTPSSIILSIEYTGEGNPELEYTLKNKITGETKNGNKINDTNNYSFKDLEGGAEYELIVLSTDLENKDISIDEPKIIMPNIISATSSPYTNYYSASASFEECLKNSEKFWRSPVDSNVVVNTIYLEIELENPLILSSFFVRAGTGSGNYQWGENYGYYTFVLMGSMDGEKFDTISDTNTLTCATNQTGTWYDNNFNFDITKAYKFYKIAFTGGGKNGITEIYGVGGCMLSQPKFSFK